MKEALTENQIRIRKTLLGLLLKKDIGDIRVTDLVKEAGVSRSTFYQYYDSVYTVLQEVEDEYFAALEENLPPKPDDTESLRTFSPFQMDMNIFGKYSDLIAAMLGPHGSAAFRVKKEHYLQRYFQRSWPARFRNSPYYPYLEAITLGGRIELEYMMATSDDPSNTSMMTHVSLLYHRYTVEIIEELIK